jgi:hypothetical protein
VPLSRVKATEPGPGGAGGLPGPLSRTKAAEPGLGGLVAYQGR